MPETASQESRIEALKAEVARLMRVNEALMNRVEHSTDAAGSAYSLFESNLLLQNKVEERTGKLVEANHELQREVAERKKTEEALLRERNFVAAVLEVAGVLIIVLDRKGRILRFNRKCEQVSGYSRKEVLGQPFWMLIPSEDKELVKGVFEDLRSDALSNEAENNWVSKTGEKRLIAWSNTSLEDANGQIEYIIATGVDITDIRQAQEALRASEERFRGFVENANDIIYALTFEGVFVYVSPNWKAILGHEVSEVEGKSFVPFVHPDDVPRCQAFLQKVVETGERHGGVEYRVKHKDGRWRWHTSNASVMKDKNGIPQLYVGVAHDITESKEVLFELEEAYHNLRAAQSQLVQSEKMASLGRLVAGIAHEINTPMGSVVSMFDTLFRASDRLKSILSVAETCDEATAQKIQSTFKAIENAQKIINLGTERIINIVRRLRSFARIDESELKDCNIHEGIEDTLTLLHHELKHNIKINRNFGDIPLISGYMGPLNQVFMNILINAKQAIEGKGEITITTSKKDDNVLIEFTDTGIGIPADKLDKIFDPGFTTKGVGIGTGLGLSICYQIIRDHHGEIKVESEVGKGTTVRIILPIDLRQKNNSTKH